MSDKLRHVSRRPEETIAHAWKMFVCLLKESSPIDCEFKMDFMKMEDDFSFKVTSTIAERDQQLEHYEEQEKKLQVCDESARSSFFFFLFSLCGSPHHCF
jgi:hypothetical protein